MSDLIEPVPGGVLIHVRVVPRSGVSAISGTRGGALLVRLHAPPVEGAANDELIEVIAGAVGVPKRSVAIVSGERSKRKRVKVEGVTAAHAAATLGLGPDAPRG